MQLAVSIPEVGDPRELVRFAQEVEDAGWDGFFLWDHVQVCAAAGFDVVDPWIVLAGAGSTGMPHGSSVYWAFGDKRWDGFPACDII